MEKVLVTGGTGFIGRNLLQELQKAQYHITVLSRTPELFKDDFYFRNINFIDSLNDADSPDIIINLAGENLAKRRWNKDRKERFYKSRVNSTIQLVDWMIKKTHKPHTFISGSAIGYYGDCGDKSITEAEVHGDLKQFQAKLCHNWEVSTKRASEANIRTCHIRTGVVLGNQGALPKMVKPFQKGLGGKLGTGKQWFSWIHIEDQIQAIMHLIKKPELSGAFNLTAPNPVTNLELTNTLAKVLNKPAKFSVPAFALKTTVGEFAELLLTGQRVLPARLGQSGFRFKYPHIEVALNHLLVS